MAPINEENLNFGAVRFFIAHNEKIITTCIMLASVSIVGISDGFLNGSFEGGAANQIIFGSIINTNSITADKLKVNL